MKRLENLRKKKKRGGRVKQRRDKEDLDIYSPTGKLLFTVKKGFCLNYQILLRKSKESKERGA